MRPEVLSPLLPCPEAYDAVLRGLEGRDEDVRRADLARLAEVVAAWPTRTRRLQAPRQFELLRANPRLLSSVATFSIAASTNMELVCRLLSLKWPALRHIEVGVGNGVRLDLASLLDAMPEAAAGLTLDGLAGVDFGELVGHERFIRLRELEFRHEVDVGVLLAAARLPELDALQLSPGMMASSGRPAELAQLLARDELQGLGTLGLRCFAPQDEGESPRLAEAVRGLKRLHTVRFERQWASTPGHTWQAVPDLVAALLSAPGLRRLELSDCATSAATLREVLSRSSLRELVLRRDLLLDGLDWGPNPMLDELETLAVHHSPGLEDIGGLVQADVPRLRRLALPDNRLDGLAVAQLVEGWGAQLEHLDLSDNPAGDAAVEALLAHPSLLERIVTLDLERCAISEDAVDRLLDALADRSQRLASARVATGNGLQPRSFGKLWALEKRGILVARFTNTRWSASTPETSTTVFGPNAVDPDALDHAWDTIDTWLDGQEDWLRDDVAFEPSDADAVEPALERLEERWADLGFRVPDALLHSWRRHPGGGRVLFEVFRGSYRAWLGPEGARSELMNMVDVDVGWRIPWLPVGENGTFIDVRSGELGSWYRGEVTWWGVDWATLILDVARAMHEDRVEWDDEDDWLVQRDEPVAHSEAEPDDGVSAADAARRLVEALVDGKAVELVEGQDGGSLASALADVLDPDAVPACARVVGRILEEHSAVEDVFVDDDELEAMIHRAFDPE